MIEQDRRTSHSTRLIDALIAIHAGDLAASSQRLRKKEILETRSCLLRDCIDVVYDITTGRLNLPTGGDIIIGRDTSRYKRAAIEEAARILGDEGQYNRQHTRTDINPFTQKIIGITEYRILPHGLSVTGPEEQIWVPAIRERIKLGETDLPEYSALPVNTTETALVFLRTA